MKTRFSLILLFLLFALTFFSIAKADTILFPTDITISIAPGITQYFGDVSILATSTPIHITKFFESNWLNYTVDNAGTQAIGYSTQPENVWIDGVMTTITNGWTYTSNIITVSTATNNVALYWASVPISPILPNSSSVSNPRNVKWIITLNNQPANHARIEIYTLVYDDYILTEFTDADGIARVNLDSGEYRFHIEYQDYTKEGNFLHIESETVRVELSDGTTTITPQPSRSLSQIVVAGAIIAVAAIAIYTVGKTRLH